jgi:hypothetical protein
MNIAIGANSKADGLFCIAIGDDAIARGAFQVVITDNLSLPKKMKASDVNKLVDRLKDFRLTIFAIVEQKFAPKEFGPKASSALAKLISIIETNYKDEETEVESKMETLALNPAISGGTSTSPASPSTGITEGKQEVD